MLLWSTVVAVVVSSHVSAAMSHELNRARTRPSGPASGADPNRKYENDDAEEEEEVEEKSAAIVIAGRPSVIEAVDHNLEKSRCKITSDFYNAVKNVTLSDSQNMKEMRFMKPIPVSLMADRAQQARSVVTQRVQSKYSRLSTEEKKSFDKEMEISQQTISYIRKVVHSNNYFDWAKIDEAKAADDADATDDEDENGPDAPLSLSAVHNNDSAMDEDSSPAAKSRYNLRKRSPLTPVKGKTYVDPKSSVKYDLSEDGMKAILENRLAAISKSKDIPSALARVAALNKCRREFCAAIAKVDQFIAFADKPISAFFPDKDKSALDDIQYPCNGTIEARVYGSPAVNDPENITLQWQCNGCLEYAEFKPSDHFVAVCKATNGLRHQASLVLGGRLSFVVKYAVALCLILLVLLQNPAGVYAGGSAKKGKSGKDAVDDSIAPVEEGESPSSLSASSSSSSVHTGLTPFREMLSKQAEHMEAMTQRMEFMQQQMQLQSNLFQAPATSSSSSSSSSSTSFTFTPLAAVANTAYTPAIIASGTAGAAASSTAAASLPSGNIPQYIPTFNTLQECCMTASQIEEANRQIAYRAMLFRQPGSSMASNDAFITSVLQQHVSVAAASQPTSPVMPWCIQPLPAGVPVYSQVVFPWRRRDNDDSAARTLRMRIISGDFVDLNAFAAAASALSIGTIPEGVAAADEKRQPSWSMLFDMYAAAVLHVWPQMAYTLSIYRLACQRFAHVSSMEHMRKCDAQARIMASNTGHSLSSTTVINSCLVFILGAAYASAKKRKGDGGDRGQPKRKGTRQGKGLEEQVCYAWNAGKCSSSSCKRRHVCSECESEDHALKACPDVDEKPPKGGKNKGGKPSSANKTTSKDAKSDDNKSKHADG